MNKTKSPGISTRASKAFAVLSGRYSNYELLENLATYISELQ